LLAKSNIKFKFIALDKVGEEVEQLQNFLEDISSWPKLVLAICIHCDNQSTIGKVCVCILMWDDLAVKKN
jgi:hypothetical protein